MTARIPLPDEFGRHPFLVARARDAGVGRSRLAGRDLQRPFWGIRAPASFGADVDSLCRAFTLRMPPHAFFTHATAARLMLLPLPRRLEVALPLHVGVAAPGRALDVRDVVGHRVTIGQAELVSWRGLRHTGPVRTWLDLAAQLSLVELVAVGDHIVHWEHPLTTIDELADAVSRYPSRRGLARAREALPLIRTHAESPRETALRLVIVLAGLPEPEPNVEIFDPGGHFLARGDLVYRAYKILLEYQGDHHRTDREQWRRDLRRLARLEDFDWKMLQYTDDDLHTPADLIARLERRLRARGWMGTRTRHR